MNKLTAIHPQHQSMVNRCISWLIKYEAHNQQRDLVEDNSEFECREDDKEYRQIDRKCVNAWNKFLEYADELPKREVDNIESSQYY